MASQPTDPLRLTTEDIAAAEEQARRGPIIPAAITITPEDLTAVPPQSTPAADIAALEHLMFTLVNQARATALPNWLGNRQLQWHEQLAAVARGHSTDMLQRGYVAHDDPEGTTVKERLDKSGIRYVACGENIGIVYGANSHHARGVHDIHDAFMRQPRRPTNHRGNLLNPIWTHVGIGIIYHPAGQLIATQNFMTVWR